MPTNVANIEFLGEASFPVAPIVEGTQVGGLSGIVYDAERGRYYAISDSRGDFGDARFYTVDIDLSDGRLDQADVTFVDATTVVRPDGTPFPIFSIDPEGIALTEAGLFVSSEGDVNRLINPFVNLFSLAGGQLAELPIDPKYDPTAATADPRTGIRNNLAFESLTISPDGGALFTATENALFQDGPAASLAAGSFSRIIRHDLATGQVTAEFIYVTDPIAEPAGGAAPFATAGLVELLAIDDEGTFLAVERSFSTGGAGGQGTGNTIRIYRAEAQGATNVIGAVSAESALAEGAAPVAKKLLLDLDTLGLPLDNIEGVSFGPRLEDGRQTVVLVSDNNFSSTAFTQFLAFAVDLEPENVVRTQVTGELLQATEARDLFIFDNSLATGADRLVGFGSEDVLLTTRAIFDSNGDGRIGFGGDKRLDLSTGRNEVAILDAADRRVTALDFDGKLTVDGVEYFAYSLSGGETFG